MTLTLKRAALALALPLMAATVPTTASAEKICTNTFSNGQRCTFCYYTTQPGSGSTTCIAWKAPTQGGNTNGASLGVLNRINAIRN